MEYDKFMKDKKFWEWCGFKWTKVGQGHTPNFTEFYQWLDPDGHFPSDSLPPTDLNNLFKYAVPKLQNKGYWVSLMALEHSGFRAGMVNVIRPVTCPTPICEDKDPALALRKAIEEVIKSGG